MKRVIDGHLYLMRDKRPTKKLRQLYLDYCLKYGNRLTFHQWLVDRGKVTAKLS